MTLDETEAMRKKAVQLNRYLVIKKYERLSGLQGDAKHSRFLKMCN